MRRQRGSGAGRGAVGGAGITANRPDVPEGGPRWRTPHARPPRFHRNRRDSLLALTLPQAATAPAFALPAPSHPVPVSVTAFDQAATGVPVATGEIRDTITVTAVYELD
ncbi:hypothetical protein [Streptomyces sp. NPDC050564]|uniref:hypothetical protein n=1 Tax=Streptomyces sp. NPDC050564 TaxID=3365631 RepID=UPI0037AB765A